MATMKLGMMINVYACVFVNMTPQEQKLGAYITDSPSSGA